MDVAKQQRLLEQENDGDDENVSDTGTLTPGREKMDVDESGPGFEGTRSRPEDKGDSLLKSRSPPTGVIATAALEPVLPTAPQPLQPTASGSAGSSIKSSYASDSTCITVASKPMGTGFNGNMYEAIRKLRTAISKPRMIGCQAETRHWSTNLGDLTSEGWNGASSAHYRHLYDAKMNISTSFNPQNLRCDVCTISHPLLEREGNPVPICFVTTDQCFPACLPAVNGGRCCAIIRVEDGSLREIMSATRNILGGKKLPVGSTILISSASHLARVGTAKYASDLVDSFKAIEHDYGNSVRAVHGFPIFKSGVEDSSLPRSILDIMDWLEDVDKRCLAHLANAHCEYKRLFLIGSEEKSPNSTTRLPLQLPTSLRKRETANYQSSGNSNLREKILPNTEDRATEFLHGLLCSLNSEFALQLDTAARLSPLPEGGDSLQELDEDILVIVGGGSHAERLASAIGSRHHNIADLSIPGWKLNESTAMDLASDISGIMENNDSSRVVVVLQLFDNETYKGLSGNEILDPVKIDGKYHILGKLVLASKEEFKALFGIAIPIIKAAKSATVLLISPLYRYATGRCCRLETHVSNFAEEDYTKKLSNTVQSLGKQLRSLVWHRHWKHVSVVNPAAHMGIGLIAGDEEREEELQMGDLMRRWGPDPVHPSEAAYDQLAETLLERMAKASRAEPPNGGRGGSTLVAPLGARKRKRSPSVDRRPSWIRESITEVGRRPPGHTGRGGQQERRPDAYGPGSSFNRFRGSGGYRGAGSRGGHHSGNAGAGTSSNRGAGGYGGRHGTHSGNAGTWHGSRKRY